MEMRARARANPRRERRKPRAPALSGALSFVTEPGTPCVAIYAVQSARLRTHRFESLGRASRRLRARHSLDQSHLVAEVARCRTDLGGRPTLSFADAQLCRLFGNRRRGVDLGVRR